MFTNPKATTNYSSGTFVSVMFRIHDIFQPSDIHDLTDDPSLIQAYAVLKSHLSGESVPLEAVVEAQVHAESFAMVLSEFYIDQIRIDFYNKFADDEFARLNDISVFSTEMASAFCRLKTNLFSELALAQIKDAWTAMVRSVIDFNLFDSLLLEFLAVNPLTSDQGSQLIKSLCELGLGPETWKVVAQVIPSEINSHICLIYRGKWRISIVKDAHRWITTEYIPTLESITDVSPEFTNKLVSICDKRIAELRIEELFEMIFGYPESEPGLIDLQATMSNNFAALMPKLVHIFRTECPKILLNNGVATVDIFLGYLKCIKSLSVFNPRSFVLDDLSGPIRRYLKNRDDAVKLFVEGLMGDDSSQLSFLSKELESKASPPVDWGARLKTSNAVSDTITLLLSLFDNKEVVVMQLTQEFSNQLMLTQAIDQLEILTAKVEALKRRFGGRQLQNIDVMIRDVLFSRTLNTTISERAHQLSSVKSLIISRLYWPNFIDSSSLKLPHRIKGLLDEYKQHYCQLEPNKQITWIPTLGRVSLSVELEDRTIDLVVTPDQAVVLGAFETKPDLGLDELLEVTGLDQQDVLLALKFWMEQGIVGSENENYHILEVQGTADGNVGTIPGAGVTAPENTYKDMEVYWSYIQHMLTNVGPLPVDRIHSFLVMLVPKETPYVKTKQQLESFLTAMVVEEKIKLTEDKFSLA